MRTMSSKKGFPAHCFSMFFVVVSIMKHQFLKPLTPEMQFVREMAGFHGQVATKKNAKDTFPYKSFRPGNRPAEGLLQGERQGCDNGGGVTVQLEGVCALLAHECREGFVKGCQVVG